MSGQWWLGSSRGLATAYAAPSSTSKMVVIAVMGPTGTGKSSFIRNLTQNKSIKVGHDLSSTTTEVAAYDFVHKGRTFSLVDTPGFDDSRGNDQEIVNGIVGWLEQSTASAAKLDGILYFHRIIDPRVGNTARANLRMFRRLCGNDNLDKVLLVTTFWNDVAQSLGERREQQLQCDNTFWKPMIDQGSSIVRSRQDRTEDLTILLRVADKNHKFFTQAQKDMQNGKTQAAISAACHTASLTEQAQLEKAAQDARLAAEQARLERVRKQKAEARKAALAQERARQEVRRREAEAEAWEERMFLEREQRARAEAQRKRSQAQEEKLRRIRTGLELQERLEREERQRQARFAAHVCRNISLKRKTCSRCFERMDLRGDGLWCWRKSICELLSNFSAHLGQIAVTATTMNIIFVKYAALADQTTEQDAEIRDIRS
ncbi:hypothetical protein LTR99_004935 [Exophiala xenobiotica]|uniref:G domain-containing protein n=1 Tax=Vermiconidia calcicola TaxID=1690605 RepID=A0AAV9QC90_9PEZI|nr:hypothetical protein LTR92_000679 [Exophiala xenobiotica]KAK5536386.1 hypothetical protein LTR23_007965 [Chaetothyriales sp. CCFEE 6169]KAK5540214.1 hypothetical protein LTR25_003920 [Vermiconidia calcicola]KAK5242004.1 hypothetical protein LTS06_011791 [Exophiala xenobiotica]KAK5265883.1 hypothetical protein LTR96_008783 [Exophiala xenobiotica]